jgi:microcystin-dependent protein
VTLSAAQGPSHTHPALVNATAGGATQVSPEGHYWAEEGRTTLYCTDKNVAMAADAVQVEANSGGGQPHQNMQPYLTVRFCICVDGMYPPRP